MFGSQRRKVAREIRERVRPIFSIIQHHRGLPAHFWTDAYFLGFFGGLITQFARLATNDTLSALQMGQALVDGFSELSGLSGSELTSLQIKYAEQMNPEYLDGSEKSYVLFALSFGYFYSGFGNIVHLENIKMAKFPELVASFERNGGNRPKVMGEMSLLWIVGKINDRESTRGQSI